jgi:hypothetical protein
VLAPVHLDGEPCLGAGEVEDGRVGGVLAAEFVTLQTGGAEDAPEGALGIGRLAAE